MTLLLLSFFLKAAFSEVIVNDYLYRIGDSVVSVESLKELSEHLNLYHCIAPSSYLLDYLSHKGLRIPDKKIKKTKKMYIILLIYRVIKPPPNKSLPS